MPNIQQFNHFVGKGLSQLLLMADLTRKRNFSHDLDAGTLEFEPGITLQIDVLAIANEENATWVWAWNDSVCDFRDPVLGTALALKELGERSNEPIFTHPQIDISGRIGADDIAIYASARSDVEAWFAFDLQGAWRAYVAVTDSHGRITRPGDRPMLFVVRLINEMIEVYGFNDHRTPILAYLAYEKFAIDREDATEVIATSQAGDRLIAQFDHQARLSKLTTHLAPDRGNA